MCCRACSGYELCRTRSKLSEDCCPQCRYFDSCMEEPEEEESTREKGSFGRRPPRR
jgi:hypothetical protein